MRAPGRWWTGRAAGRCRPQVLSARAEQIFFDPRGRKHVPERCGWEMRTATEFCALARAEISVRYGWRRPERDSSGHQDWAGSTNYAGDVQQRAEMQQQHGKDGKSAGYCRSHVLLEAGSSGLCSSRRAKVRHKDPSLYGLLSSRKRAERGYERGHSDCVDIQDTHRYSNRRCHRSKPWQQAVR